MLNIIIYLLCVQIIHPSATLNVQPPLPVQKHNEEPEKTAVEGVKGAIIDISNQPDKAKTTKNETLKSNSTKVVHPTNTVDIDVSKVNANVDNGVPEEARFESGTLIRGICVMVALSFIFIIYLGIKTYSKKGNKPNVIIRKYGVRARRNDVEMEPLPLSDDEDDETVFDLGNVANKN